MGKMGQRGDFCFGGKRREAPKVDHPKQPLAVINGVMGLL